eukprot:jgi/Phyca11/534550/estExt2_fgenesh1_pg.C_PHYCAscaffold_250028
MRPFQSRKWLLKTNFSVVTMEKTRQPSPRTIPRGLFSAQMLRPPSSVHEKEKLSFVTTRRGSSEEDNQELSPPPPPPRPYQSTPSIHPLTVKPLVPTPEKEKQLTSNTNPIDVLTKKLRQQAMELTKVYEKLETQKLQMDAYKQQLQDQKKQLEKRRKSSDQGLKTPVNPRLLAVEQQKRAAQMMLGTPSTGASLGQKREELDRTLEEAEKERKKYQVAAKRIEKALVELQVFQNDRMDKLLPSEDVPNQEEDRNLQVLNEQRAYIRVLEEAVHLKATDFEVTGHEELLVVLAELRHTIYEQERDVEEKSRLLTSLQSQLDQEEKNHLITKENLVTTESHQRDLKKSFCEQIEALEKQLTEKNELLKQLERVSTDTQRTREALEDRIAAATKAQSLAEAQLGDAMRSIKALEDQLTQVTTKYKEAQQQSASWSGECVKKQTHLDELNALQEELLQSVDKYVQKVKKWREKVERLEAELESYKEKETLIVHQLEEAEKREAALKAEEELRMQQFRSQCATLEQQKLQLENALSEAQQQAEECNEQQRENAAKELKYQQMQEAMAELEATLSAALGMIHKPDVEEDDIEKENKVGKEMTQALVSWTKERSNLVEACGLLDSTARICRDEMEKRQEEVRECREQLAELDSYEDQLRKAETEHQAFRAIEKHPTHLEDILEAKQTLIRDLSAENDRLSGVESAYSVQVATNTQISDQLREQQETMKEQKRYTTELEEALETAAAFAEQQNQCNHQCIWKCTNGHHVVEMFGWRRTKPTKSVKWSTIIIHEFGVGLGGSAVSNKGGPSIGLADTPEFTWTTRVGEMAERANGLRRFSPSQRIRLLQAAGIPDGIITRHARETNIILSSRRRSKTSWENSDLDDDDGEEEREELLRKRSADQAMLERPCAVYSRRPRMIPTNYV